MSAEVLRGEKTVLREKRLEDAPRDYAWGADLELARLDATLPLKLSYSDYLIFYAEELEHPMPWRRRFAIESLDGKHIGNCMYYDINEAKGEAELGIMIGDRAYWDKGCGYDAVTTLLNHMFQGRGLKRVYLHTLEWNIRAQKCFGKCGFVPYKRTSRNGHSFLAMEIHSDGWGKRAESSGERQT